MTRFLIISILFHFYTGYINAQQIAKVRIDPAKSYGGKVSDYFDNIEFIPLETSKESLFGDIAKLIITDSTIVVSDYDTRSVLYFTLDGTFIKRINEGENKYPNISYNPDTRRIVISVYNSISKKSEIKNTNIWGTAEKKMKQSTPADGDDDFVQLDANFTATFPKFKYQPSVFQSKSSSYLINIRKNGTVVNSFLPVTPEKQPFLYALAGQIKVPHFVKEKAFYVSTPFDHVIYRVDKDSAKAFRQLVFPENRGYQSTILNTSSSKIIDSIIGLDAKEWRKITNVSNIFFIDQFMFFKTSPRIFVWFTGSEDLYQNNFIYDTLSGKLTSLDRITPDSSCSFLPLTGKEGRRLSQEGLIYTGDYFYFNVSALKMFEAHIKNREKNPQYTQTMTNFFRTQDRKSNPVIVRMKFKRQQLNSSVLVK